MQDSQSFHGATGKIPTGMGRRNPSHSQGISVSGRHPGVLPCSVLAPCRSVRNNWVSSAQPLNISWIFLPDFSCAQLPAQFIGNKGMCWEFRPQQLQEVGSGPGTAPEPSLPILGFVSSLKLQGGMWEGKFPKIRWRRKRKHGNGSDSLVLPHREFLGCNSWF